jgi:hypothetical protein
MNKIIEIFFPKKFFGISVKYFIILQILIIAGIVIFWMKDVTNGINQSKILEEKFYKAELRGKILMVEKSHGTCLFKLDNDTSKYVVGFARNNNYNPSNLIEYMNVDNFIIKESNSNTILINNTYKFILFKEIE